MMLGRADEEVSAARQASVSADDKSKEELNKVKKLNGLHLEKILRGKFRRERPFRWLGKQTILFQRFDI
jgi:hypothetical protein